MSHADTAVIIPAAGSGERLGVGIPKALVEISGQTLLERAVQNISAVAQLIVIAAPPGFEEEIKKIFAEPSVLVVAGGKVRSESVANALKVIPSKYQYVLVHDAARAFAPTELAERVLSELIQGQRAVIPALDVVDTIKVIDAEGFVVDTPNRSRLRAVQTPQGFTVDVLKQAHATGSDATDDAALVSQLGIPVKTIIGEPLARKITTLADLTWARELVGQS